MIRGTFKNLIFGSTLLGVLSVAGVSVSLGQSGRNTGTVDKSATGENGDKVDSSSVVVAAAGGGLEGLSYFLNKEKKRTDKQKKSGDSAAAPNQISSGNTGNTSGTGNMVTYCHATGSASNPYETITVSENSSGHSGHAGDFIASSLGCPAATIVKGSEGTPPIPTPEPVTMLLFGAGLAGVGYVTRRRSRSKASNEQKDN